MSGFAVIVPVHNALSHARNCISSLLAAMRACDHLYLVDDASHRHVGQTLSALTKDDPRVSLITLSTNVGYLDAINTGIMAASAPYFLLLNSDTIVLGDTFERLDKIFSAHPDVAIVNPVSTWANWTRIPFPAGQSIHSLYSHLRSLHGDSLIDIFNASGFCIAVRAAVLDEVGSFDSLFAPGYWEETDLCMRVLQAGHRVCCAPGLYVFHHGWGTFGPDERNQTMARNELAFRRKWGSEFRKLEHWYRFHDPLAELSSALAELGPHDSNLVHPGPTEGHPSVLYVLPSIDLYGGIISVLQIVNQLTLAGVSANIATYGHLNAEVLRHVPLYVSPLVFRSQEELIDSCPSVDVLAATHWATAYVVKKMQSRGLCRRAFYFVQDYEPDFYSVGSREHRLAEATYALLPHRVCKTEWLRRRLCRHGGSTEVIPLGLDLDEFFDRSNQRARRVVSMVRPNSARRNWKTTKRVFEALRDLRPDIECAAYGFSYAASDLPPGVYDYGTLAGPPRVAQMLNEVSCLLDCSTYQGFGRPGLEAMATGTCAVLTRNGGITSFAKHRLNCRLVDPMSVPDIVRTICDVLDSDEDRIALAEAGKSTAARYCHRLEGRRTRKYIESLE